MPALIASALQFLTRNRLVSGLVFVSIFTMALRYPASHDTWWHLQAAETMLAQGGWLTEDVFSHTRAGTEWINHGWLGQLFWYALFQVGGWTAVGLGLAVLVTASFGLAWWQSEGNLYLNAFSVVLAAIASSIIWSARPQMLSFFFTALLAALLWRYKQGRGRLLPWIPLLMLVWVNTHGGFAIGLLLLIAYLVGEVFNRWTKAPTALTWAAWRRLALASGLSLAAVGLNPHTWQMWVYPFRTVGIGVLRDFIAEWQSPDFHLPLLQVFLAMVLLLLLALARSGRRMDWTELALVGGWLTMSAFAVRNVPIFALICAPILAKHATVALEAQFGPLKLGRPRPVGPLVGGLHAILLTLLILGAVAQAFSVLSPTALAEAEAARFPADAVAYVQENRPPGPLFNSYNLGGYLMYHLWPDYPVFVDGRTDLYDDDFLRRYLTIRNLLPGWQETLLQTETRLIIIERGSPLAAALQSWSAWEQTFVGEDTVIFERVALD